MSIESKPRKKINIEANPKNVEKNKEEGFKKGNKVEIKPQMIDKVKISEGINEGVIEKINKEDETAEVRIKILDKKFTVPLEDLTKKY